jgi:hypothetical protein
MKKFRRPNNPFPQIENFKSFFHINSNKKQKNQFLKKKLKIQNHVNSPTLETPRN